jgi:hypothetical protein
MAVHFAFADLHEAGAFDHSLFEIIDQVSRLGIPLQLLMLLDRNGAMSDPGCAGQSAERRRQQKIKEKPHKPQSCTTEGHGGKRNAQGAGLEAGFAGAGAGGLLAAELDAESCFAAAL